MSLSALNLLASRMFRQRKLFFLLICAVFSLSNAIGCTDEYGDLVDWETCKPTFQTQKILTLSSLYILETLCLIHKKILSNPRNYIVPPAYHTRQGPGNVYLPIPTTSQIKKSVIYNARKMFNQLPEALKTMDNKKRFRRAVKERLLDRAYYSMDEFFEDDWFVIYKLPKQKTHSNTLIKEGIAYTYMTSKNYSAWIVSDTSINDTQSMLSKTLSGLYDNPKQNDILYVLYNDQPPYGLSSESTGHTKGVVLASGEHGIWLIHSVPHFPHSLKQYVYPTTGVHYGQSFMCISLDLVNLNKVGLQLQYNEPHIYAENIPIDFQSSLPELFKAANNITVKNSPWYNVETLNSTKGTEFVSFAKSGKFGKDLYSDLVSIELKEDLLVETWPNEPNRLPSECDKKFQVDNILSISIAEAKIVFNSTVDHSKWAVTPAKDMYQWVCIGDINRAEKQTLRGGGTTCLNNEKLAYHYQNIVSSLQECINKDYYIVEFN